MAATAHLFQERLPKICDVRVTVVGDRVFATEIDNPAELDWRRNHADAGYRPHALPDVTITGVTTGRPSADPVGNATGSTSPRTNR